MKDIKWKLIKNCEILHVYQKLPTLWNTYLIELISKDENDFNNYHKIKIDSSKLYEELLELKEDKRERCYFAYGMADIDIYKKGKKYIIMNSPTEISYVEYELSQKQFDKLLNDLMPR